MPVSPINPQQLEPDPRTLIGTGFTAEVFASGEGRVLKLFFAWVDAATVEREYVRSRAVYASGAPTPAVYELVQIGERYGIIFERIDGDSMVTRVARKPWRLLTAARELAELHARTHDLAAPPELPVQREQLERRIARVDGFSEQQKQRALGHTSRLPDSSTLCHGDFHPGNILYSKKGPVIIDWSAATRGHAPADVARTSVLFEQAPIPSFVPLRLRVIMKFSRRLLHSAYLKAYLRLRPGTVDEIEFWRVPQRFAAAAWQAARQAALTKAGKSEIANRDLW